MLTSWQFCGPSAILCLAVAVAALGAGDGFSAVAFAWISGQHTCLAVVSLLREGKENANNPAPVAKRSENQ